MYQIVGWLVVPVNVHRNVLDGYECCKRNMYESTISPLNHSLSTQNQWPLSVTHQPLSRAFLPSHSWLCEFQESRVLSLPPTGWFFYTLHHWPWKTLQVLTCGEFHDVLKQTVLPAVSTVCTSLSDDSWSALTLLLSYVTNDCQLDQCHDQHCVWSLLWWIFCML